ncbi:MAG: GNAT family N-acetyltransferase [Gemmatimonadetes bacterium]|nr:GNAT family N-acetyltransferase [Gemmatimonadota bacterium]
MPGSSSSVVIRRLQQHDLHLYRAIRTEALATEPDAFGETLEAFAGRTEEELRDWFTRHVGARDAVILVKERDGVPVGMCGCGLYHLDPRDGYLWGMFVSPSARRQGVGAALLREAVAFLRPLGVRRMRARVTASNRGAVEFYRRAGFAVGPPEERLREGSEIPVHAIELDLRDLGRAGARGA